MQWNELFNAQNEPSEVQINEFIGTTLWDNLDGYLREECKVKPKLSHSNCAMDNGLWKGWNVKYKKSGKAICTIYPKQGYFLLLMPIGLSEMDEAELIVKSCTEYTQNIFNKTALGRTGKSLAFDVTNEDVLDDIKKLTAIRGKKKVEKV